VVSGQWLGTARQGSGLLVSSSLLLPFSSSPRPRGYTLIEILVATALTLLVLAGVVQVFGTVSESISDARSFVEKVDQLRITQRQLRQDLAGETAPMTPPLTPEAGLGYFEYVEGPWGPVLPLGDPSNTQAVNIDRNNEMDSTQGDVDDVLMFTTRSRTVPFVGRVSVYNSATQSLSSSTGLSQLAEVAWFVRGRTLYRRVLLIAPETPFYKPPAGAGGNPFTPTAGFYNWYDVSARYDPTQGKMVANSLADLTRPENRFAHANGFTSSGGGPYYFYPPHPHNLLVPKAGVNPWLTGPNNVVPWPTGPLSTSGWLTGLKLPTLCESTSTNWDLSNALPTPALTVNSVFDAWRNPYVFNQLDPATGNLSTATGYNNSARVSEDVILTNVIGFDVKAWDPSAPIIQNTASGMVLMPGDPGYIPLLEANENNGVVPIGYGAYVDLNYLYPFRKDSQNGVTGADFPNSKTFTPSTFSGPGSLQSGLYGSDTGVDTNKSHTTPLCSVYDTWCSHLENYGDGQGDSLVDQSYNGFDNTFVGVVNNGGHLFAVVNSGNTTGYQPWAPPYQTPLRGIQVKIRVYEPDSRQVREVTVTQSFVNE
jgi:type II secretory pathway component PulJ